MIFSDDMIIGAPSLSDLHGLVNICENFASEHDILYKANIGHYAM